MNSPKKHNRRVVVQLPSRSKFKIAGVLSLSVVLMAASMGTAYSIERSAVCIQPDVTGDASFNVLDLVTMANAIVNGETDTLCVAGATAPDVDVERGPITLSPESSELVESLEPRLSAGNFAYDWEYVLSSGELVEADGIRFAIAQHENDFSVTNSFGSEFRVNPQGRFLEALSPDATAIDSQRLLLPTTLIQGQHYTRATNSLPYTSARLAELNEANERSTMILSGSNRIIGVTPLDNGASLLIVKRNLHHYVVPTTRSFAEGAALDARGVFGHSPGLNEQVGATWAYYAVTQTGSTVLVAEAWSILGSDSPMTTMNEVFSERAQNHPLNAIIRMNFERSEVEDTELAVAILNALQTLPTTPTHLFADYLPGAEIASAYSVENDPCENVEQ